jgi:NDP-sugar pyrophosphorylase family protein
VHLLGSAGAARSLDWFLNEAFFVLYGDVLTDLDLTALARQHNRTGAVVSLALYEVEDPSRCGMVETESTGRIKRFIEKPRRDLVRGMLANAGIYVVDPSVFSWIPSDKSYDFGHDIFPKLLERGVPMYAFETGGYILDIGSPERYAQAQADFEAGRYRPTSAREVVDAC